MREVIKVTLVLSVPPEATDAEIDHFVRHQFVQEQEQAPLTEGEAVEPSEVKLIAHRWKRD
ncbi:hypothetical protein [Motilimonas pumila]|uniref:Uncharacterized protein n=1 Tax=Motilimonas pumila TaxID=2303987 RepID=A0A418Y9H4_9GAMM|nr:hypothetical protein [Motilimonas pumila]RJG37348.1 hypothetical protein D1Z90_19830 [Motilimonas pumila]